MKSIFATYDWKTSSEVDPFKYCPFCAAKLVKKEIGRKPRSACTSCGFIHFRNPAPAVSILIMDGGRILLGKRIGEPGKDKWALPSGYIDYDEDFITAATREVRDETGLEVEIQSILHVESSFLTPQYHFLGVYLLARVTGGSLRAGDDLGDVNWFSVPGPLPQMAFQSDQDLIEMYAAKRIDGLPIE